MQNTVTKIERLLYQNIVTADNAFHAVRAAFPNEGKSEVRLHCHDYYEWIVVLNGEARHQINRENLALRSGHLVLIRPDDCHAIFPDESRGIEFVNIAFPSALWEDSVRATGLQESAGEWNAAASALCLQLIPEQSQSLAAEAMAAVRSYNNGPTRLAFSQFWRAAAGALTEHSDSSTPPLWLREMLLWAQSVDIAALSLETLIASSGVSFGHFSRTLKAHMGVTPTEYINEIRVKRAAYVLATTDADIAAIAFDCGFENLSYFYRRFRQFHGKTPRRYREDVMRPLPL